MSTSRPYITATLLWRAYCSRCARPTWRWHRHRDIDAQEGASA